MAETASPATPFTPLTPSTIENSDIPWRKKVPFNLIGRGVAGVEEMSEYLDDTKVYFGLFAIEIGSGSFKRHKSIFVHFNGEKHPKPLQRAKANKKMNAAKKLFSPYHAELVLENTGQCTIDYIFHRMGHIFVADDAVKGTTKFEIGSLKEEYKKKMKEARKKAKAEKERLEKQRAKLLAQQEEERRIIEENKRKKEEEERKRKEAEEEALRLAQEEEERKRKEAEEEAKRLKLEQEEIEKQKKKRGRRRDRKEKKRRRRNKKKEKEKKKKKRKKDDWGDDKEWTGKRIVKCIHAQTSPMNWAVFKPSDKEIIPMAFGHGDLNDLRAALKPDQMQYGIMRLTFGEGRFRRSHWVFVCWSPDSMTKVDSQKIKKKRMNDRMVSIGYKGEMQRMIGPYGVEVIAEDYDYVTLEDWILRVRKTVVVDGDDELMNADAFRKALEAEKAHFDAMKKKKEEERKKKQELERKLNNNNNDDDTTSEEEDVYDKDEAAKNRKKRRKKKKKNGNNDDDDDDDEEDDDEDEEDGDKKDEERGDKEEKKEERKVIGSMHLSVASVDRVIEEQQKRRKSSIDPSVLKARDVSSQLCYESITLIKRPDTDLVWVLIEPRLKHKGGK